MDERGDWQKVSIDSKKLQGWIHNTALTSKRIVLKAGQENVGSSVSSNEIALAGKVSMKKWKKNTVKPIKILITHGSTGWKTSTYLMTRC